VVQYKQSSSSDWLDYTVPYTNLNWSYSAFPLTVNTIDVVGLTNGTSYDFRVAGCYNINAPCTPISNWSDTLTKTPTANASAPGAPVISATNNPANSYAVVGLNWTAPANNGSSISNYVVYIKQNANDRWYPVNRALNTGLSVNIGNSTLNLAYATTYDFKVGAVNANGFSGWSNVLSFTTYKQPSPVTSPNLDLTSNGGITSGTVTWNAPANNGSAITNYQADFSIDPSFCNNLDSGTTPTLAACLAKSNSCVGVADSSIPWNSSNGGGGVVVDSGIVTSRSCDTLAMQSGETYYYRIRAANAAGWGQYGPISIISAGAPGRPQTVTAATGTAGGKQVVLTWSKANANGNTIDYYYVEASTSEDFSSLIGTNGSSVGSAISVASNDAATQLLTFANLNSAVTYYFRVVAHNIYGNGAYSIPITASPTNQTPTTSALTVGQSNDNGATYVALTGGTGGYVKGGYKLYVAGTITDSDVNNWSVSYSLSGSTTPSTWTVCRSVSSTRMEGSQYKTSSG
jgi:hypothetical protein